MAMVTKRRDDVLRIIRDRRDDLMAMGVTHAAIFGSVARGNDRPDSDVDVMIEVNPDKVRSILAMGRIQMRLSSWLGGPVDVVKRNALRPGVSDEAERDAVHAF